MPATDDGCPRHHRADARRVADHREVVGGAETESVRHRRPWFRRARRCLCARGGGRRSIRGCRLPRPGFPRPSAQSRPPRGGPEIRRPRRRPAFGRRLGEEEPGRPADLRDGTFQRRSGRVAVRARAERGRPRPGRVQPLDPRRDARAAGQTEARQGSSSRWRRGSPSRRKPRPPGCLATRGCRTSTGPMDCVTTA